MKHLTTYKLFESDISSVIYDIEDIFISSSDINNKLKIEVDNHIHKGGKDNEIYIFIVKNNDFHDYDNIENNKFSISDVEESMQRLSDFIKINNIKFEYALFEANNRLPNQKNTSQDKLGLVNSIEDIILCAYDAKIDTKFGHIKIVLQLQ